MIIGIYGSADIVSAETSEIAVAVGSALARRGCIVVTGACSGLPYRAAYAAAKLGAEVWGFSPATGLEEQRRFTPDDDLSIYTRLDFIPPDFPFAGDIEVAKKYRNVLSTAHCDAGIVIAGRWGTLHEVCSLIDYGKVVGILGNAGGIADELPRLWETIPSRADATMLFDDDPVKLVEAVCEELGRRDSDRTLS